MCLLHLQLRAPSLFGNQEQRVQVGVNVNLVARQLVGPTPAMLGLGGGETIRRFGPGVLIRTSFRAGRQLLLIILEIVINTFQFAAQAVFLAGAHAGHFARHFVFKRQLQQLAPSRRMEGRPDDLSGRSGAFLVEAYISRKGLVGFSAGQ